MRPSSLWPAALTIAFAIGALQAAACDSRAPVSYSRDDALGRLKAAGCSKMRTCNSSNECCWFFGRTTGLSEQESRVLDQCVEDLTKATCANWQTTYVTDAGLVAVKPTSAACREATDLCSFKALAGPHVIGGYDPKTWTCE